jgi:hypothetical protein
MPKRAQDQKSEISSAVPKRAQEEIVGFSMIIVIVAIALVILLSFSLRSPEKDTVESYEVESFLQALMQKTSDCRSTDDLEFYSVKKLIFTCYSAEKCLDGRDTCEILLREIGEISNKSWSLGQNSPVKGYKMSLSADGTKLEELGYGNQTKKFKGASQELTREGVMFNLEFKAYY